MPENGSFLAYPVYPELVFFDMLQEAQKLRFQICPAHNTDF